MKRCLTLSIAIVAAASLLLGACSTINVHRARASRAYLGDLLYVERSGSGAPVVFLPGLMGSTRFWEPVRFSMSNHTLIFVDELGFGRSPWPDVEYTLDDHLAALRRTLTAEGATSDVTIVAHSFGTILAAHYAARFPDEVDRLYLLGTPLFRNSEEARARMRTMSTLAALFSRSRTLAMGACILQDALGPIARFVAPLVARQTPRPVAEDATLHFWPALDGSVRNVILSRPIEVPLAVVGQKVTFIHGRRDPITPMERLRAVAVSLGAKIVEVPGDHGDYIGAGTDFVREELESAMSQRGDASVDEHGLSKLNRPPVRFSLLTRARI
ncbi:MAG TPA: alpha/beta hydrolase [Thermoanaerobaculia bacterium]|nr:alpha/beta hydrolase [Thermoanaerobaculia bacterium]